MSEQQEQEQKREKEQKQEQEKINTNNKSDSDSQNSANEQNDENKDESDNEINNESNSESDEKSENSEKPDIEEVHEDFDEKSVGSNDSIENDDDYIKLKEELDKANNLIDYFLILGLEPNIFMNKWLYENDADILNKVYKDKLQPKILSSFPCFEKHTIAFDDSILTHCFPYGFELISSQSKPKSKLFSFILDNNYFNLNYPQKYLTCLLFYENIAGYRVLYEQNQKLSEKFDDPDAYNIVPEMSDVIKNVKNKNIYVPKCLLIISLYPYFSEFEKILTEIYSYSINLVNEDIKGEQEDKKDEKKKQKDLKQKRRKIYQEINVPIDKIVENLCIELPEPPRGVSYLEYNLNNEKRIIKQNLMNQLPIININFKKLFLDFEIKDIVSIYNYLFLETRILFFSKNIEILNIYIYGLLALLYPFQYQYQIVTILPEQNFEIMESITPFIAGINQTFQEDFFEKRGYTLSDLIVVVDIDNNKLVLINEESKVPEFPKGNEKTLKKNLQSVVNKYMESVIKQYKKKKSEYEKKNKDNINNDNPQKELEDMITYDEDFEEIVNNFNIDYEFNKEINEIFFNFNANLLANYSNYLNLDFYSSNIMPCLEILFKVEDYLKEIPAQDKEFYEKFISETQIFGDFLYLRMIPKNSNEKIRILLFDEKINQNSTGIFSKPPPMIFTNSTEYNFSGKYIVKPPRKLNKDDIFYIKEIKNRKRLLEYGVIVSNDDKNKEKYKFKYPIFPKLTTKIFFQNMLDYSSPKNWNEEIDNINVELISKSHLGGVTLRKNDMINYVYLCWMQMWAMTLWYCDSIEQKYRFQELLKILENSHCYDMEIFNLLFEATSIYGKDFMVLKLYDLILKQHLNPSYKVHSIVMKIIDKQNVEGNFNDKLQNLIGIEMNKKFKKTNFKKRAFRTKDNKYNLSEEITFMAFDTCPKCKKEIDLERMSKDFKNMGRDLRWAKCADSNCGMTFLPKLTLEIGKEINKNGCMRINTCNYETVPLYTPFTLKNNYKTTILKKYNVKLDVEEYIKSYKEIFWVSLWYFKLNNLEYDFMLPYEDDFHVKMIPNDNLYITIKGSIEKNGKKNIDDIEHPRFDYYKMKISNFSFCIKDI